MNLGVLEIVTKMKGFLIFAPVIQQIEGHLHQMIATRIPQ